MGMLQEACAGVTTGQVLCACVGSPDRAEYTVYGDAINLSARLMMKAAGGLGSVLCDVTTQEFASRAAAFAKLSPMKVAHCCTFQLTLMAIDSASVCRLYPVNKESLESVL